MVRGWFSKTIIVLLLCCFCSYSRAVPLDQTNLLTEKPTRKGGWRWGRYLLPSDPVKDVLLLQRYLFTWDTYKVVVGFFPFFIAGRMIDEDLQQYFHCRTHHKNRHQLPERCHDICKWGIALPIAILGSTAFLAKDYDFRMTGWIFLLGMPFVIVGKDMFKKIKADCCLRPWHEKFSHEHRSGGGFPSGHMAEITYMTVLYAKRYGRLVAAPLAAVATMLAVTFVSCNRHYLSQIVAGAGLGTAYALAADKLIDRKLSEHMDIGFTIDSRGAPAAKVSFRF